MAGLFAAAMSSLDSAVNAMASSAVADLRPRNHGAPPNSPPATRARLATSRVMVVAMGTLLTVFAVGAALLQQAGGQTLIDFALGVMSFAYAGLLGVFGAALFTRRGNVASVIAALVAGAYVVLLLQPWSLGWITERITGERFTLPFAFWLPIASAVAFGVCIIPPGRPRKELQA